MKNGVIAPNKFFFSDGLRKALISIFYFPMTILCAPLGYGKKVAASGYLLSTNASILWMNFSEGLERGQFWLEFHHLLTEIQAEDDEIKIESKFPGNTREIDEIIRNIRDSTAKNAGKEYVLVVNAFQNMAQKDQMEIFHFLRCVANACIPQFHIVLITSKKPPLEAYDQIDNSICIIGTELFRLSQKEISRFFEAYGIQLNDKELEKIETFSEGWLSALSALVIVSLEMGKFDDRAIAETARRMMVYIQDAFFSRLDEAEKQFIAAVHDFEYFSKEQAQFVCKRAGLSLKTHQVIDQLLEDNFLIHYHYLTGQYHFHGLVRQIGRMEFQKLEVPLQHKIKKHAHTWAQNQKKILVCGGFTGEQAYFKKLTAREREICFLLKSKRTYREIGEDLFISENTVKTVVKSIYRKLEIHSKRQLWEMGDNSF